MCELCRGFFCREHVIVKKGVATCEPCAAERERREAGSRVSADDEARVVSLLRADVEATLGPGHDETIIELAARPRLYAIDPGRYVVHVVEDVQQRFHDLRVDTTWPSCPDHPHHPLWLSDGWWRCQQTGSAIAPLGGLSTVTIRERKL